MAVIGELPEVSASLAAAGAKVRGVASPAALVAAADRYDLIAIHGPGHVGSAMAVVAGLLTRLAPDGSLLWVERAASPLEAIRSALQPRALLGPASLAPILGLVDQTPPGLAGVRVFARPTLTETERRDWTRAFRLEGATRVGVFGWPPKGLPLVQALAPHAEIFGDERPGRVEVAFFFAQHWADHVAPRLKQRLAGGGVLIFVCDPKFMKPGLVLDLFEPLGFVPIGKPAPMPHFDGWRTQRFELKGAKKAAAKKVPAKKAAAKKVPAKKVPPKQAVVPPAMPPLPARSDDPLGRKLQAALRPAIIPAKLSALKGAEPTSVIGPVTWMSDPEWPQANGRPLLHQLSVRIDELPFVPPALSEHAFVSIFVGPRGPVVRTYDALAELQKRVAPERRAGDARAIRWAGAHDCPCDQAAATMWKKSVADVEAAREAEALDHLTGVKIGGWPTELQDRLPEQGFVLQMNGWSDDSRWYLYDRRGWQWESQHD